MPVAIEQHADWITDCIRHLNYRGLECIEARADAMDKWVAEVNEAAHKTVLPLAKHSWYLGANIPGKPRVFMPYAGVARTCAVRVIRAPWIRGDIRRTSLKAAIVASHSTKDKTRSCPALTTCPPPRSIALLKSALTTGERPDFINC